jgi:hypothetical protein
MKVLRRVAVYTLFLLLGACATTQPQPQPTPTQPYQQESILIEAESFFGRGAQGVADVLNRVFTDNGTPDAYIKGEEGSGSLGFGLRYGHGTLYLSDGTTSQVYWNGPSVGFDVGSSASKVFVLIYDLQTINDLYQRFSGVEGSLFFMGGVGVNYNRRNNITLAPVRLGVGLRMGVSVGYLHLSPNRTWFPL